MSDDEEIKKFFGEFKFNIDAMSEDEVWMAALKKTREHFDNAINCFENRDTLGFTKIVAHVFSMAAGSLIYAQERTNPGSTDFFIHILLLSIRADIMRSVMTARKEMKTWKEDEE